MRQRSPHVTDCQLRAWVLRKVPREEIARRAGLTTSQLSLRLRVLWSVAAMESGDDESVPDEQEIREACEEIQRGWSWQVRESRRVGGARAGWTPAVVPGFDMEPRGF